MILTKDIPLPLPSKEITSSKKLKTERWNKRTSKKNRKKAAKVRMKVMSKRK